MEIVAFWVDVPDHLVEQLISEGYLRECSQHGLLEVGLGFTAEQLDERIETLDPITITEPDE
jgi:hypothetical protein